MNVPTPIMQKHLDVLKKIHLPVDAVSSGQHGLWSNEGTTADERTRSEHGNLVGSLAIGHSGTTNNPHKVSIGVDWLVRQPWESGLNIGGQGKSQGNLCGHQAKAAQNGDSKLHRDFLEENREEWMIWPEDRCELIYQIEHQPDDVLQTALATLTGVGDADLRLAIMVNLTRLAIVTVISFEVSVWWCVCLHAHMN